ncbi:hypothetical protein [Streptomyces sp. WMMC1477]|uniref:hypothetical protein n=1 Tax=Streptomyces sp. WMMC1477 TaxID=3015155 RepID=UPI0022B71BC7|nr:hypothetical protein [Streptomyces sp. WMMC1477]MCZ7430104.1 hypothetical protein [Streptomyces sp. WMMC1477]
MTTSTLRAATAAALRSTTSPVRALTLRQPWATCVAHLGKDVENRSWPTPATDVLLLIHAGGNTDRAALREAPADLPGRDVRSAIVAVTRITGCHQTSRCHGRCSTWADPEVRWHWTLADTLPLTEPVPATGTQRLWHPTPQLRSAVATALEEGPAR